MTDQDITEDFVITAPTQAPVGTMPGIITRLTLKRSVETMYGTRDLIQWDVTATGHNGQDYQLDGITGTEPTPRAKLTKWLAAAGVKLEGGQSLSPDEVVGKAVLVVVGENDDGYSELVDIVAAPNS